MYMASCALPGTMSLNSVARYFGQSEIITSANLSSPNDRRDRERDAQEHERLSRRLAAQHFGPGYGNWTQDGSDAAHGCPPSRGFMG